MYILVKWPAIDKTKQNETVLLITGTDYVRGVVSITLDFHYCSYYFSVCFEVVFVQLEV